MFDKYWKLSTGTEKKIVFHHYSFLESILKNILTVDLQVNTLF